MMREAQKMMKDPVFQEKMKQYTENEAVSTCYIYVCVLLCLI